REGGAAALRRARHQPRPLRSARRARPATRGDDDERAVTGLARLQRQRHPAGAEAWPRRAGADRPLARGPPRLDRQAERQGPAGFRRPCRRASRLDRRPARRHGWRGARKALCCAWRAEARDRERTGELNPESFQPAHFQWDYADGAATVTLNLPERKNPLTFDSYAELRDPFRALVYAKEVKAVVVAGAGGNFSSGGDVHEIIGPLTDMEMPGLLAFTRMTGDLVKAMRACPQPIVT